MCVYIKLKAIFAANPALDFPKRGDIAENLKALSEIPHTSASILNITAHENTITKRLNKCEVFHPDEKRKVILSPKIAAALIL